MDSDNTNKYNGLKSIGLFIFKCVMVIVYLAFGIVLLFTDLMNSYLQVWARIGLGIAFGLYGVFRVFRAYKKITIEND